MLRPVLHDGYPKVVVEDGRRREANVRYPNAPHQLCRLRRGPFRCRRPEERKGSQYPTGLEKAPATTAGPARRASGPRMRFVHVMLPVLGSGEGRRGRSFRDDCGILWSESTRCANWLVSSCMPGTSGAGPRTIGFSPMPPVYLYPEARVTVPGAAGSGARGARARRSTPLSGQPFCRCSGS